MRIIFYIFLSITSVIIAAIIIAPSIFDINTYKNKIAKAVYHKTGYNLKIKGPLKLAFLPKVKIYFQNVQLFKESSEPVFTSEKIYIYPSLIELLKGEISFEKIYIEKALLNITETKDSENNGKISKIINKNNFDLDRNTISSSDEKKIKKEIKDKNLLNIKRLEIKDSFLKYKNIKNVFEIKKINLNLDKKKNSYNLKGSLFFFDKKISLKYIITPKENYDFNLEGKLLSNVGIIEKNLQVNSSQSKFSGNIIGQLNNFNDLLDLKLKDNLALIVNTEIAYTKKKLKLSNMVLKSAGNEINALVAFTNSKRKNINIELNANTLDLNNFLFKKKSVANKTKENIKIQKQSIRNKSVKKPFDNTNLVLNKNFMEKINIIESYNLNVKLMIDSLKYENYEILNLKGSLNKKNSINLLISGTNPLLGKVKIISNLKKSGEGSIEVNSFNTNLETFTGKELTKIIVGKCDSKSSFNFNLNSHRNLYENISGTSKLIFKNLILKNINIKSFKDQVLNLKEIEDISKVSTHALKGNSTLKNQHIALQLEKGVISMPSSKLVVDENNILLKGNYNILKDSLIVTINFDNKKNNILLSLFGIEMSGKSSNIKKKILFDQSRLQVVFENKAKKKLEKMIKKKLEKKFDNVIDKLLN